MLGFHSISEFPISSIAVAVPSPPIPPIPPLPPQQTFAGGSSHAPYQHDVERLREEHREKKIKDDDYFIEQFLKAVTNIINSQ